MFELFFLVSRSREIEITQTNVLLLQKFELTQPLSNSITVHAENSNMQRLKVTKKRLKLGIDKWDTARERKGLVF